MKFSIKGDNFYFNDKKVFLNSGEIHYFRIKRGLWRKHLEAAGSAGLSTVSTYIPWALHEYKEQMFDFDGATSPELDLRGWLQLCHDLGLNCILKPGPFILAEFRGAGLPDWFLSRYGDKVRMRDSRGNVVQSDGVSLFNANYLEKTRLWYDRIMPLIGEHEISSGGPVIMVQICNEIGVFSWLARQADYGNKVRDRFISYLLEKFSSIEEVNQLWGTGYSSFAQVELPPDGRLPYASRGDRCRDYEWHLFWRKYYADYLILLARMVRERGVTVPLYHNLPGWIYGHGYEFPVNITMYQELFGDKSEIIFGVDHIPEFQSYRNLHDDRIINDITYAMQGSKPIFAAEFQSGSREYHVVTNPREMELFYKASLANGLTGWNYYMFSQGRNPRRRGYSGETFYWFSPLTPEGESTSAFPLVSRMSKIIKTSESHIVSARRRAEVCVLFYPPYYTTELERPAGESCKLKFTPSAIRRPAYFDGLLKALQILNIDYDMADLSSSSATRLGKYKQVWAFCTDEMNAPDQQTIVDYAEAGGNVVLFPSLPDREMSQRNCTIICDALSANPSGIEIIDSPLIDIFDLKDIKCSNPQVVYPEESMSGSGIIARTINGSVCGFEKSLGKGSVVHLGTWIGFDTEGHKEVYKAILQRSGAVLRHTSSGNGNLIVRERFSDKGGAILFVGNYYNEEQTDRISYLHPETGESVSIPCLGGEMTWPPLYGMFTPVCLPISGDLKILHCTSDILDINLTGGRITLKLYGDRDMNGELVLEGSGIKGISSVTISGNNVGIFHDHKRTVLIYKHQHRSEIILDINLK